MSLKKIVKRAFQLAKYYKSLSYSLVVRSHPKKLVEILQSLNVQSINRIQEL